MSQAGLNDVATGGGATQFTADSGIAVPAAGNINIFGGSGCSTTASGSTITIDVTGSGTEWTNVTGATVSLIADRGFVMNRATLITATLPLTAAFGTSIGIQGLGAGGWIIAQNAGQQIIQGINSSTVGVGGSVASTQFADGCELLCVVANTTWMVRGPQGNFTFV